MRSLVVLAVCAAGNYGYGLNDHYDVEEDRRAKRANAAVALGGRRIIRSIVVSAFAAELLAAGVAGTGGAMLTFFELLLPLAYSVPPLRLKERKWLGIAADAAAAHVYPAVLALAAVAHLGLRPISAVLALARLVRSHRSPGHPVASAAHSRAGPTERPDRSPRSGPFAPRTLNRPCIAGDRGGAFLGIVLACNGGPVLWVSIALYAALRGVQDG